MNTAELIPVSQWVYNLYKVSYWTDQRELGGKLISTIHVASTESHIPSDAVEYAPQRADWMTWDVVKEGVGHPRVIGNMHGHSIHEDALSFGRRLAQM
jgi:hypothetical protein